MPEQDWQQDLEVVPHGFGGFMEPRGSADNLSDFAISDDWNVVLSQVLPSSITQLCAEHRPNKTLWRSVLEIINTLMQSELDGEEGPWKRLEFAHCQDLHDWFRTVHNRHRAKLMAVFRHDEFGVPLPQEYENPYLECTYMRNTFRRSFEAGPVRDFAAIPIEEWLSVMGITFYLDVIQDIHAAPPGWIDVTEVVDSAVDTASEDENE